MVASREILDRQTPSSELCMANGASAMVFDQRVFMSLNPFNIYVAQPEVKPGCVLRRSNWSVLERNKLVARAFCFVFFVLFFVVDFRSPSKFTAHTTAYVDL